MEWLNKIFDWFLQFVPQFEIVLPREEAIRITCIPFIHKWHKLCKYGWYMYWPLFQKFEKRVIKSQLVIVELSREVRDRCVEAIWVVQYRVTDLYNALYKVEDIEEILVGQSAKAIGEYMTNSTEITGVIEAIKKGVWGLGIEVQDVFPLQIVPARAHKIFLDNLTERVGRIVG